MFGYENVRNLTFTEFYIRRVQSHLELSKDCHFIDKGYERVILSSGIDLSKVAVNSVYNLNK